VAASGKPNQDVSGGRPVNGLSRRLLPRRTRRV